MAWHSNQQQSNQNKHDEEIERVVGGHSKQLRWRARTIAEQGDRALHGNSERKIHSTLNHVCEPTPRRRANSSYSHHIEAQKKELCSMPDIIVFQLFFSY